MIAPVVFSPCPPPVDAAALAPAHSIAKEEKTQRRQALVPLLQAEEDQRWIAANDAYRSFEGKVMEKRPEWNVDEKLFNSDKVFYRGWRHGFQRPI